jgi:hypothetical protein
MFLQYKVRTFIYLYYSNYNYIYYLYLQTRIVSIQFNTYITKIEYYEYVFLTIKSINE